MSTPIVYMGPSPDGAGEVFGHDDGGQYIWGPDGGVTPVGGADPGAVSANPAVDIQQMATSQVIPGEPINPDTAGRPKVRPKPDEDLTPAVKRPDIRAPDGGVVSRLLNGDLVISDGKGGYVPYEPPDPEPIVNPYHDPGPPQAPIAADVSVRGPAPVTVRAPPVVLASASSRTSMPLVGPARTAQRPVMVTGGPAEATAPARPQFEDRIIRPQSARDAPPVAPPGMGFGPSDDYQGNASASYPDVVHTREGGVIVRHNDGSRWLYQGDDVSPVSPAPDIQGLGHGGPMGVLSDLNKGANPFNTPGYSGVKPVAPSERDSIGQDTPSLTWEQLSQPGGLSQWLGRTYDSSGRMLSEAPPAMQMQQPFEQGQGMLRPGYVPDQRAPVAPSQPGATPARSNVVAAPAQPTGPDSFQQSADAGSKAIDAQTDAQVAAEKAKAAVYGQQVKDMDAQRQQMAQDNQRAQAQSDELFRRYNAAIDDAAQAKIDPEHWEKSRTAGQQIAATIGLALGSFAQAIGGTNGAAEQINAAVKRDVDAQAANLQQKNATVAARGSAIGQFLQMTGDKRLALAAYTDYSLKQTIATIDKVAADSASPIAKAAADAAKVKLQGEVATNRLQFQKLGAEIASQKASASASYANTRRTNVETDQMLSAAAQRKAMIESGQLPPDLAEKAVFRGNGQRPVLVAGAKDAERLRPMVGSADSTLGEIDEAERLAQEWGSSSNRTEAGAKYALKLDSIVKNINQSEGISQALQSEQIEMYKHALGNGATTPTAATLAALKALRQSIQSSVNHQVVSSGGQPIYSMPTSSARPGVL